MLKAVAPASERFKAPEGQNRSMPTAKEISEIKELASEGKSVNNIKEKLDLPKSTVYYHFKKEVGQKQKEKAPEIPADPEFKGELCGIFAGDGNYRKTANSQYKTRFTLNSEQDYWKILRDYIEERTGRAPHIHKRKNANTVDLLFGFKCFVELYRDHLSWGDDKTATIRLKNRKSMPEKFQKGFLRGLLDTDGSLRNKRFFFTTISSNLANDTKYLLKRQGFEPSLNRYVDKRESHRPVYNIKVSGNNAKRFYSKIKPRHPSKKF